MKTIEKKHPQSRALAIGKYSCLAMCYLYCIGIDGDEMDYIKCISDAIDNGYLDSECTVLDANKFLFAFSGRKFEVEKKVCASINNIKDPTPVRYTYQGNSHWVVVENGEIVFNSLLNSVCVSKGRPDTMRVIHKSWEKK